MSNQAAILKEQNTQIVIEERPIPKPGANELLIKNAAFATNPVDWKMQSSGMLIESYPTILGSDIAGTVEEVGSGVSHFKKGDRVAGFADVLVSKNNDNGAFQQYTILKDCAATRLPSFVSFEEGSILPMAVATAGVSIFLALDVPRPPAKSQGGFLVWGASSSVGTAAIQIAASLGYTVYGVCSPRHSVYIKKLGAHETFDYNDSSVVKKITQSLKAANEQLVIAYDAIVEHGSAQMCVEILEAFGGGKLCLTSPYPEDARQTERVEISSTYAARVVFEPDFGRWLFNEWLQRSLADKTFVPSPAIEKVDGGIQAVQKALDMHKKGLSGKKLVITL
jgi:NADPH:quinone reductase-like Zn-dependent oxidoreductase